MKKLTPAEQSEIEARNQEAQDVPNEAQEPDVSEEVLDAAMDGDVRLIQQWWKAAQESEELKAQLTKAEELAEHYANRLGERS